MQGDCCEGRYLHILDDMGSVCCSYWHKRFDENSENDLCEICEEIGGPCSCLEGDNEE